MTEMTQEEFIGGSRYYELGAIVVLCIGLMTIFVAALMGVTWAVNLFLH